MKAIRYCWTLHVTFLAVLAAGLSLPVDRSPAFAQTAAQAQGQANENAQLRKRVEQLEEQLIDIQVVLGTLETLAKSRPQSPGPTVGPSASSFGAQPGDNTRLDALETQLRALASQVQQLSAGQRGGGAVAGNQLPASPRNQAQPFGSSAPAVGFGSTTVQPEAQARNQQQGRLATPGAANNSSGSFLPSSASGDAQSEYEAAYGLLLQQDYGAAQTSFSEFLKKHPRNPLAGNAQYWLGETYYVRGKYKFAAGAFLKGYRQFSRSNKAPDSLLKLAMSLDKLGQRAAACSSLSELGQKYPQAAAHVRRRASQERNRLRC